MRAFPTNYSSANAGGGALRSARPSTVRLAQGHDDVDVPGLVVIAAVAA